MSADELILALQRALDRLVRRLRVGPPPAAGGRRLLIVQIDGLSREVLLKGLATGQLRFTKRLLDRHHYRLEPMSVSLPTSTAAFQMGAMYGVRPDIPSFHYYDRRLRGDDHFPRPGHAARVERDQAPGRSGILEDGSAYGCVFPGGAANDLFSFARLTRPSGRGLLRALSPLVVVGWVVLKNGARTVLELVRAVLRVLADPLHGWRGWRWLTLQIGLSVWVRGFFTLAASRDLYAGRRRCTSTISTTTCSLTPSDPRAGQRCGRCVASTARSTSSGAWSGASPSIATTSTSSPTTARRRAGHFATSPGVAGWSAGSSSTSWSPRPSREPGEAVDRDSCAASALAGGRARGPSSTSSTISTRIFSATAIPRRTSATASGRSRPVSTPSSTCWTRRSRWMPTRSSGVCPGSPKSCRAAPGWASAWRARRTGPCASGAASAISWATMIQARSPAVPMPESSSTGSRS